MSWKIRLQREFKELAKEPLQGIDVFVHEDNMQNMCLVLSPLSGPYAGLKLHLSVDIPSGYPGDPPRVSIQTRVPHPNVLGDYICCDILNMRVSSGEYTYQGGYTPGYLLKYVFLQLLSFFSSRYVEQSFGGTYNLEQSKVPNAESHAKNFRCTKCGFNVSFSAVSNDAKSSESRQGSSASPHASSCRNMFEALNMDCCEQIVNKLHDQDVINLTKADKGMKRLDKARNLLLGRELFCFYLRKTYKEQDTVLGVGVDHHHRYKRLAVMALDLLSYEAFDVYKCRQGVFGAKFSSFLPVALDEDHYRRANSLIKTSLVKLAGTNDFTPETVLKTLPTMMNTMVLGLVQSCDKHFQRGGKFRNFEVERASERALQGYCLLYHLFSKLVRDMPELASVIQRKVDDFVNNIELRGKQAVPDLGEFLTYLLVSKGIEWQPEDKDKPQVCRMYLGESLARRVVWYLRDYPHLAYEEPDNFPSELRLRQTFASSKTSFRLCMFQVQFFHMTRSMDAEFDQRCGFPTGEMSTELLRMIKEIYRVNHWDIFLKIFGIKVDEGWKWHLARMLKASMKSSLKRGYHVVRYTESDLYKLRRGYEPRCPPPQGWVDDGNPPARNLSFFPTEDRVQRTTKQV